MPSSNYDLKERLESVHTWRSVHGQTIFGVAPVIITTAAGGFMSLT